jgi:hypothetical protein
MAGWRGNKLLPPLNIEPSSFKLQVGPGCGTWRDFALSTTYCSQNNCVRGTTQPQLLILVTFERSTRA